MIVVESCPRLLLRRCVDRLTATKRACVVMFACLLLAACGGGSIPKPQTLNYTLKADDLINVNTQGIPSPILVRIYELKSATIFEQSSFFDLLDNDTTKLATDMLGKREFTLKPGDELTQLRTSPADTRYVGVIAGFRDLQSAEWRASTEIVADRENDILVTVDPLTVRISRTRVSRSLSPF